LLAGQRDKGKGRRRKTGSAKAAPRKAANTGGARDRVASGTAKKTAVLNKQAAPADQSKLVGSWSGFSKENGQSAFFQVVSVDGRDAQVRFTANGGTLQSGDGIVYQNTVMLGSKAQFTTNDGQTGNVVLQIGHKTYSVPVTRNKTPTASSTSSSSVNKLA